MKYFSHITLYVSHEDITTKTYNNTTMTPFEMMEQLELNERIRALPNEIQDLIAEYDPNRRTKMNIVMEELKERCTWKTKCDNYDCENSCCYDDEYIVVPILFQDYRFCCMDCAGEGEENIRYEYRKFLRSRR